MTRCYLFAILICCLCLPRLPSAGAVDFDLQILHTNDMQSRFEETDTNGNVCTDRLHLSDSCIGGFPRLKAAVDQFREEAKKENIPTIFLNAGDTLQGSPYHNKFKSVIAKDMMLYLGIQAMSLGNHEFDDGIQNLASFCTGVGFPIVAANLDLHLEPDLEKCDIAKSIVLKVDGGLQIGIIGYLTTNTKQLSNTGKVIFKDEIAAIREEAASLKSRGINIIIGLGHAGLEKDKEIAEKVPEISLIVGGHSHILFHYPKDYRPEYQSVVSNYPIFVEQKSHRRVPIVHACCNTEYLGKIKVKFNDDGEAIIAVGNTVRLNSTFAQDDGLRDTVDRYKKSIRTTIEVQLGRTNNKLWKEILNLANTPESNFGNLVADAFVHYAAKMYTGAEGWTDAAIALIQEGSIRTDISNLKNDGSITYGDLLTSLPFQNRLVKVKISGSALKSALEYSVENTKREGFFFRTFGTNKYLFTSGIRVKYDLSEPVGQRVVSLYAKCSECAAPRYLEVHPSTMYTVVITDYLLNGGDGFSVFTKEAKEPKSMDVTVVDAVANYIKGEQVVYPGYDGRATLEYRKSASSSIFIPTSLIVLIFTLQLVRSLY